MTILGLTLALGTSWSIDWQSVAIFVVVLGLLSMFAIWTPSQREEYCECECIENKNGGKNK
jgi:predicted MFS family arabinose efflux permease